MKKVLITGAGGFVGKYLIKEFQNSDYEIIACDINKKDVFDTNYISPDDLFDSMQCFKGKRS